MGEVVNFNKVRKRKAQESGAAQAVANRAKHGRCRAEQDAEAAEAERRSRELDGAKRED